MFYIFISWHSVLTQPLIKTVQHWMWILRWTQKSRYCSTTNVRIAGGWGLNPPTVFSTPLTHCQIMYWGVSYMIYTCDLPHDFGRAPTVEKFNTPANFLQFKHWAQQTINEKQFYSAKLRNDITEQLVTTLLKYEDLCIWRKHRKKTQTAPIFFRSPKKFRDGRQTEAHAFLRPS